MDFSGAADAGHRIWLACGTRRGGAFVLEGLRRGDDLPDSTRAREPCLAALRAWIEGAGACAIGMDFPFGLPLPLVEASDWRRFILDFEQRFASPEAFRAHCIQASPVELKRRTDREARVPFCVYNLRLFRQTWFGIARVLAPLVEADAIAAPPMQTPRAGVPWLLEACPASVLKRLDLYQPYKGRSDERRAGRARIVKALESRCLAVVPQRLRSILLDDAGGDALDAVLAALAALRAVLDPGFHNATHDLDYALEAHVYA